MLRLEKISKIYPTGEVLKDVSWEIKNGDVLISAVVSSYLLTHLHHVLQRAEYGASKEGRSSHAANFAQLRKVLCMDARSMKDASALGLKESDLDTCNESTGFETKAA